jgi:hypothetical protein
MLTGLFLCLKVERLMFGNKRDVQSKCLTYFSRFCAMTFIKIQDLTHTNRMCLQFTYTVQPVLRGLGHLWDKEKVVF